MRYIKIAMSIHRLNQTERYWGLPVIEPENDATFDEQMARIYFVTGTSAPAELADFLGARPSAITSAEKRGAIPSDWLVILMRVRNIHPEWILTGKGTCHILGAPPNRYETHEETMERWASEAVLKQLPSRVLADELVRRIAVSQADRYCRSPADSPDARR